MILVWVFFTALLATIRSSEAEDQLLAVNLLYRHGDRTPVSFYPNDPYKDPSLWPTGLGQLTNLGKQQHYELGEWIRNRYNGFLSPIYEKDEIYVRSSDEDRCLMSAASNLAGLYPPKGKDVWNDDLSWQPIPIHSIPEEYDDIAEFKTSCTEFKKLEKKVCKEYFKDYDEENEEIYRYLTEKTGEEIKSFVDTSSIYGTLHIEQLFNFTLPEWSVPLLPKLKEYHDLKRSLMTYTPKLTLLSTGRFFENVIEQFTYFANETVYVEEEPVKFKIFSAHDSQITCLLVALNGTQVDVPYAAVIIFELRKSEDEELYVQVLYKSDTVDFVQIKKCDINCDFDEFLDILEPMSLTKKKFKKLCNN